MGEICGCSHGSGKSCLRLGSVRCSRRADRACSISPFCFNTQLSCLFILASRPRGQQRGVYRNLPNSHNGMRTEDGITMQEGGGVETGETSRSNSRRGRISIKLCINISELPWKHCGRVAEMLGLNALFKRSPNLWLTSDMQSNNC